MRLGKYDQACAYSAGMKDMLDQPEQMALWRDNPELDDGASKELMRWRANTVGTS